MICSLMLRIWECGYSSKDYISQPPLQLNMVMRLRLGQQNARGSDAYKVSVSFLEGERKKPACPLLNIFPSPSLENGENWSYQPHWT